MSAKKAKSYLFLDTSQPEMARLAIFSNGGEIASTEFKTQRQLSELMSAYLDKLYKKARINQRDLDGVVAVTGPGSFSGLRTGIAFANVLSFVFDLPTFGVRAGFKSQNIAKITQKTNSGTTLKPYYGKEPNITRPKTKFNFLLK